MRDNVERRLGALLWHRIVRLHKDNSRKTSELLQNIGLSNSQLDIITTIARHQRLSQQELANALLVTKGNITQQLSKLEDKQLIKRQKEWRTNYIILTNKGMEVYRNTLPKLQNFQAEYFSNLNKEEQKQLLTLLKKVNADK